MDFLAIENASSSSSSSSIPSSSTPGCKYEYDVFLSFRGTDTRNNFTDHLYDRLKQEGIFTFRDDERLKQGTEINSGLLRAIDESKIAVVVLSKQYASSSWCLIELAKIVECMDKKKLTILPVFHYVDPSDVRNQRGSFAEAFAKHENRFEYKIDDVKTWRAALTKVTNLSGWHLKDNSESEVIKKIIQRINSELDREVPFVSEHLVGMDSRVKEMLDLCLGERLNCVRLVGICGMGGIGKTTLAREVYNRIFHDFEARSFVANVREESKRRRLVSLQKNILSKILMGAEKNIADVEEGKKILRNRLCKKKVLIVLDDVNDDEQLKALAGKDWFGPGSIIIVTSRDSHLLNSYWDGVFDIYIAKGLNDDEALELFSLKAFKKPHPQENYVDLSINFVSYANGLPLALRVLGSSLFGKTLDVWRSARDKLEAKPNRVIMDVLEMSVDGLDDTQRDLFLDIAFLFKDMDNYCRRDTLESLGHYTYDIDVLQDKSLITFASDGALEMHDLLKEMGQDIVRRESPEEPGKRSRLWSLKDVLHVLTSNAGTEVVKCIMLNMPIEAKERLSAEAFSKMKILRFLKIGYVHPPKALIGGPIQLPQGLNYLSNELRIIDWHGYPLKSMPTSFQPNKLVELRMHYSEIEQLWKGIMILYELKLIDLSDSQNLIEIPDLSGVPNLKQLILQRCTRLSKIHASLGDLKRLIRLDLNGCKCLESLPHKINSEALETFIISGCSRLKKFPEVVGMESHDQEMLDLCLGESFSPRGKLRRSISSWQKGELLGSGSFGTVYEGYTEDGFFFAVKEVSLLDQGSRGKQNISYLEQEISLLKQFEHENIVEYLGMEKDESRIYIFLELITKGSLASLYQKYRLRDSQVSAYTRQILNGLKYLHDKKVIHRDIKCSNILVDASGSVKLADFGLAKVTKLNDIKSCKGTPFWMAPEVVNLKNGFYGLAADIWSLGCTVLEMLTRQYPYSHLEGVQALFMIGKGKPPLVPDSLSRDARDFILKCLQVNPNDRPTAIQLLDHPFVTRPQNSFGPASPHNSIQL